MDIKSARFQKTYEYVKFSEFCVNRNKSPLYIYFFWAKVPHILKNSANGGCAVCHFLIKREKEIKSRNLLLLQPNMQSIVMSSSGHENKGEKTNCLLRNALIERKTLF